jgi:hypothetical protein
MGSGYVLDLEILDWIETTDRRGGAGVESAGESEVTDEQRSALHFLASGWKLRFARKAWRLKQPDYVSNFMECPGGEPTIAELLALGYIDSRNNITQAGIAAAADSGESAPDAKSTQ